eukprot:CAMPEP_0182419728 /NCGR_PEP_ID=MMETSP1167-20130531/4115_1 /TAXON_ID=2988 /ORGANISM="Mallomonas Sp, Strain CCMP3275" /LENGTH=289 /DNA_ID=CAMNT_0024594799 /DNA_START=93 /DNA_END=962 /DNA_ORIENTATION=+
MSKKRKHESTQNEFEAETEISNENILQDDLENVGNLPSTIKKNQSDISSTSLEENVNVTSINNTEEDKDERNMAMVSVTNGGDEGVLEGVAIGEGNNENFDSDSESEREEEKLGIIIHLNHNSNTTTQRGRRLYEKGGNSYIRPESLKDITPTTRSLSGAGGGPVSVSGPGSGSGSGPYVSSGGGLTDMSSSRSGWDDIKSMQFGYHRTAFDINIDELEEQPWRLPHTDISDYFNYGFTEATWLKYCENQLQLRIAENLGPINQALTGGNITSSSGGTIAENTQSFSNI